MDKILDFGRSLVYPRGPHAQRYENHAERTEAMLYLRDLALRTWLLPVPPRERVAFWCHLSEHVPCLGLLPMYNTHDKSHLNVCARGQTKSNLHYSNLTEFFCHDVRARSRRQEQKMTAAEHYQAVLPQLVQNSVSSFRKYTGKDLLDDPGAWELELAYRVQKANRPFLFPACIPASFFNEFDVKSVLDITSKWGDVLLAAVCQDLVYVGADPSPEMQSVYQNIINATNQANASPKQRVIHGSFENIADQSLLQALRDAGNTTDSAEPLFDMLFSALPWFNAEVYSESPDESYLKYPDLETWKSQFLFASLAKANRLLRPSAFVLLNSMDHGHDHVDDMLRFCSRELGWQLVGVYGIILVRDRIGGFARDRGQLLCKPLWFFRKS